MTTKTELLSTINALHDLRAEDKALIAQLQARLDQTAATCAFCGTVIHDNDPARLDHWQTCETHPARQALALAEAEIGRLRALVNRRVTI
jgi:hypothetical protein